MQKLIFGVITFFLLPLYGQTQVDKTGKLKSVIRAPSSVISFSGDLIEGERRRPELFYQSNIEDLSLDAILYLREDFNDFHAVDSKRRPAHFRSGSKK